MIQYFFQNNQNTSAYFFKFFEKNGILCLNTELKNPSKEKKPGEPEKPFGIINSKSGSDSLVPPTNYSDIAEIAEFIIFTEHYDPSAKAKALLLLAGAHTKEQPPVKPLPTFSHTNSNHFFTSNETPKNSLNTGSIERLWVLLGASCAIVICIYLIITQYLNPQQNIQPSQLLNFTK